MIRKCDSRYWYMPKRTKITSVDINMGEKDLHLLLVEKDLHSGVPKILENNTNNTKLGFELQYDPAIPFSGIYPKNSKTQFRRTYYSYIHCSIICNRPNSMEKKFSRPET